MIELPKFLPTQSPDAYLGSLTLLTPELDGKTLAPPEKAVILGALASMALKAGSHDEGNLLRIPTDDIERADKSFKRAASLTHKIGLQKLTIVVFMRPIYNYYMIAVEDRSTATLGFIPQVFELRKHTTESGFKIEQARGVSPRVPIHLEQDGKRLKSHKLCLIFDSKLPYGLPGEAHEALMEFRQLVKSDVKAAVEIALEQKPLTFDPHLAFTNPDYDLIWFGDRLSQQKDERARHLKIIRAIALGTAVAVLTEGHQLPERIRIFGGRLYPRGGMQSYYCAIGASDDDASKASKLRITELFKLRMQAALTTNPEFIRVMASDDTISSGPRVELSGHVITNMSAHQMVDYSRTFADLTYDFM